MADKQVTFCCVLKQRLLIKEKKIGQPRVGYLKKESVEILYQITLNKITIGTQMTLTDNSD